MTANFPTRNRSFAEPVRSSNNEEQFYYPKAQTRPVSWHSSFQYPYPSQTSLPQQFCQSPSDVLYNETMVAYGLVTPQPLPVSDESYLNTHMMPLSLTSGASQFTSDPSYSQSAYAYPQDLGGHYTPVSAPFYDATDSQLQNMAWPPIQNSTLNITTAPASPDFAPLPPVEQSSLQVETEDDKEELVGMGLYDSPAQVRSANLLFGGSLPVRRKSLKLEESFEPLPQSDDGEGETNEEEDGDAESEPELEEQASAQIVPNEQPAMPSYVPDPIQQYYDSFMQDQMRNVPLYSTNMSGWI